MLTNRLCRATFLGGVGVLLLMTIIGVTGVKCRVSPFCSSRSVHIPSCPGRCYGQTMRGHASQMNWHHCLLRQDPDLSCTPGMLFPPLPVGRLFSGTKSCVPFSVNGRTLVSTGTIPPGGSGTSKECGASHTKRPSQLKVQKWGGVSNVYNLLLSLGQLQPPQTRSSLSFPFLVGFSQVCSS